MFSEEYFKRSIDKFTKSNKIHRAIIHDNYILLESFGGSVFRFLPHIAFNVRRFNRLHNVLYLKASDIDPLVLRIALCVENTRLYYTCFGDEELMSDLVDMYGIVGMRTPRFLGVRRLLREKYSHVEITPYYVNYY